MRVVPPERHLLRARDLVDASYAKPLDVADLARAAGLSRTHFATSRPTPQSDAVASISTSSPGSARPVTPKIVCAGCPARPVTSSIPLVMVSYSVGVVV